MFKHPHQILGEIARAVAAVDEAVRQKAEADAGMAFPFDRVAEVLARPRYENLEAVDRDVMRFMEAAGTGFLVEAEWRAGRAMMPLFEALETFRPFRQHIMPECHAAPGGGVELVPHFAPHEAGVERYHSLGSAAYRGAITATVFAQPIKAVEVYPGAEVLAAGLDRTAWPEPCGVVSEYRVAILDGEVQMPPRHPSDIRAEQAKHAVLEEPTP